MAAPQKVQARPRKWLTPVVLVLLQEESSYGYELMERIEEEFGSQEEINPGAVYRTLRQMEKEELCSSVWDDVRPEGSPPRSSQMYAITDAGEAYLGAWAEACEKYRQIMDEIARVYARRPHRSSE